MQSEIQELRERPDLPEIREELLSYPNVWATGIGYRFKDGKRTGEPAILADVYKKFDKEQLEDDEVLPKYIRGIRVDVIEAKMPSPDDYDVSPTRRNPIRPLVGGLRISRQSGAGGTLGVCMVDGDGDKVALTNRHVVEGGSVFCDNNDFDGSGLIDNPMFVPETQSQYEIGKVKEVSGWTDDGETRGDWATVKLDDESNFTNEVIGYGTPTNIREPTFNDVLVISSMVTGMASTDLVAVDHEWSYQGCTFNTYQYWNGSRDVSTGGASGSLIGAVDPDTKEYEALAIHFAGGTTYGYGLSLSDPVQEAGLSLDTGEYDVQGDGSPAYFETTAIGRDSNGDVVVNVTNAGGSTEECHLTVYDGSGTVLQEHETELEAFETDYFTVSTNEDIFDLEFEAEEPWNLLASHDVGEWLFGAELSPDGSQVAVASNDNEIVIYNTESLAVELRIPTDARPYGPTWTDEYLAYSVPTRTEFHVRRTDDWSDHEVIDTNNSVFNSGSFSHDGQYLIFTESNGDVPVYDTDTWTNVATITVASHGYRPYFTPDDNYIVLPAGSNETGAVYDSSSSDPTDWGFDSVLMGPTDTTRDVSISPDGRYAAMSSDDGNVYIYNVGEWSLETTLTEMAPDRVLGVAFSNSSRHIAYGGNGNEVHIHKTKDWSLQATIPASGTTATYPHGISWSDELLAFASYDRNVYLVSARLDPAHPTDAEAGITSASAIPITSGSGSSGIAQADIVPSTGRSLRGISDYEWKHVHTIDSGSVRAVSFSPDGQYVAATTNSNKRLRLYTYGDGSWPIALTLPEIDGTLISSVEWSPDGSHFAYTAWGGEVYVYGPGGFGWDLKLDIEAAGSVYSSAFSPDGQYFAFGEGVGGNGDVHIYDTSDWSLENSITATNGTVESVAFSEDGQLFSYGTRTNIVDTYSVGNWSYQGRITLDSDCRGLVYSSDYLAVADRIEQIRIFDADTRDPVTTFYHGTDIPSGSSDRTLAFSNDEEYFAYASNDGSMYVVNTDDWSLYRDFDDASTSYTVAWSPDDRYLINGNSSGGAFVYQTHLLRTGIAYPARSYQTSLTTDGNTQAVTQASMAGSTASIELSECNTSSTVQASVGTATAATIESTAFSATQSGNIVTATASIEQSDGHTSAIVESATTPAVASVGQAESNTTTTVQGSLGVATAASAESVGHTAANGGAEAVLATTDSEIGAATTFLNAEAAIPVATATPIQAITDLITEFIGSAIVVEAESSAQVADIQRIIESAVSPTPITSSIVQPDSVAQTSASGTITAETAASLGADGVTGAVSGGKITPTMAESLDSGGFGAAVSTSDAVVAETESISGDGSLKVLESLDGTVEAVATPSVADRKFFEAVVAKIVGATATPTDGYKEITSRRQRAGRRTNNRVRVRARKR